MFLSFQFSYFNFCIFVFVLIRHLNCIFGAERCNRWRFHQRSLAVGHWFKRRFSAQTNYVATINVMILAPKFKIFQMNQNKKYTHHRKCKDWFAKIALKNWNLRQKHQIHLCFLRWHICQERGRKERLEIDRPVGSLSIDWYCRTVLTIVKMKELLSNYSSVVKRRDNFFVYKGQSIMGLILEVDRIGLSHGEAVW